MKAAPESKSLLLMIAASAMVALLIIAPIGASRAAGRDSLAPGDEGNLTRDSVAPGDEGNLIRDSELKSPDGGVPKGWKIHTIPDCGFRYAVHSDPSGGNSFELINDAPIESVLEQEVHLAPGWYSFSADIKIESVGSSGPPPQLLVQASSFPVEDLVHPLKWSNDWQKYHAVFRAGERVRDFVVGCNLGAWGRPNKGRFLFRNPTLVPTKDPKATKRGLGLQMEVGYDLEGKVEERYFRASARATEESTTHTPSVLSRRWTTFALDGLLILISALGWWWVSPRGMRRTSS